MPDDADASDEERAFREAVKGARPLDRGARARRADPLAFGAPSAPPARGHQAQARAPEGPRFQITEEGERTSGRAPGVRREIVRALASGEYPVDAQLDLHRRGRAQAEHDLTRFITAARAQGRRCLLIVHGRGEHSGSTGPVLKTEVVRWLTEGAASGAVMAFASAPPSRGGTGATLVLVRR